MKNEKKKRFDINKCVYSDNPVYISKILDPYTARIAQFLYDKFALTANMATLITFILGMLGIVVMYFYRSYMGLVIVAILITLRNIGDTIDGKIARGTNTFSSIGGFSDIIADWLFFHAGFFIVLGIITNNVILGFLCVTGYMSREFARRKFTEKYGLKITETNEAKKLSFTISLVRKYDLASWFWIIPMIMLINPVLIIYITVIMEYGLLFGELFFDYALFLKQKTSIKKSE